MTPRAQGDGDPGGTHAPLIEQLVEWVRMLEPCATQRGAVERVIRQMRQVAADLARDDEAGR